MRQRLASPLHVLKRWQTTLATRHARMISVFALVGDFLVQGALSTRDTVIMKQLVEQRGLLDQISTTASAIMTIALLVLTVFAIPGRVAAPEDVSEGRPPARARPRRHRADHRERARHQRQRQLHHDGDSGPTSPK